jgi:hypothetical protein
LFTPSNVKPDAKPKAVQESTTTYSFPDAYAGQYEFFDGRPIKMWLDENAELFKKLENQMADLVNLFRRDAERLENALTEVQRTLEAADVTKQIHETVSKAAVAIDQITRQIERSGLHKQIADLAKLTKAE